LAYWKTFFTDNTRALLTRLATGLLYYTE